ncbi:MAG: UvrD-helicase domain-containing protein [Actinomycetota bacterium]|nr:UvrD-helicase domain-containing protein [Actinomycetota bacterium]
MSPTAPTTMHRFDPAGRLPTGTVVLEASAGTGKTYTMAGLVARYVAQGYRLPELLVVTFTRAATAELRDRVRRRLVSVADHLEHVLAGSDPDRTDDRVAALLSTGGRAEVAERRRRLLVALGEFDAATIATIHGFCQHVLHGAGLAGDVDRDATLVDDQGDLVEAVVDDLMVRRFHRTVGEPPISRRDLSAIAAAVVANSDATIVPQRPADRTAALRVELARAVRTEVADRKRAASQLSYDDLLARLAEVLGDPHRGPAARRRLRAQYRIALVDEFQDTDPVQCDILSAVFGGVSDGRGLILIGDPKQAIYRFRGADVHSYLTAATRAPTRYTLDVNWRSDGGLLHAYNVLFRGAALGHPDIAYRAVKCSDGLRHPRLVGAPSDAPLRIRFVARHPGLRTTRWGAVQADAARRHIAADLAADVVGLLESGAQIISRGADGGERSRASIRPADIAVLVPRNVEAALVQRSLRDVAVPAVINGVGSVFATPAATDWLRLLEALERPASSARARAAALTPFVGWNAQDVAATVDQPDRLVDVHLWLHRWAAILRHHSVASLVQTLTTDQRLAERLLAREAGERLLTDIHHIGELLHAAATAEEFGVTALTNWLRARIAEAGDDLDAEERARRLESDAEAVQVVTIHGSKGLEFPVVYCPFLWSSRPVDTNVPMFHDPGTAPGRIVDVGGDSVPDFDHHQRLTEREQKGEDLRMLYVALTRARHQAVVWWVPAARGQDSAVARVLFCRSRDGRVLSQGRASLPSDADAQRRLGELAARAGGTIAIEATPPDPKTRAWTAAPETGQPLAAATFDRSVDGTWQRASYTALIAVRDDALVTSEPAEHVVDDEPSLATAAGAVEDGLDDDSRLRSVLSPLADVPGGADVGTFVHAVLEHTDFAADDLDRELTAQVAVQVTRRSVGVGDQAALVAGLRRVIETPLGALVGDVRLRDVTAADRLDEVAFELPLVPATSPSADLAVAAIGELLATRLAEDGPLAGYPARLDDPGFRRNIRGYLTGSIDLVVRVRGPGGAPRFVVVDHKTNRLGDGDGPLTAWHYRPAALADAMARGHYPLQALLYSVALHRYLRWRLDGYRPETHLGGVLYLFVRGMTGADVPRIDGQPCGVFPWRPPASLIEAVSDLLDRGTTA